MYRRNKDGNVDARSLGAVIAAPVLAAAAGVAIGAVRARTDHALGSMLLGIVLWCVVGAVAYAVVRFGHIRRVLLGALTAALIAVAMLAGNRWASWHFSPRGAAAGLSYTDYRGQVVRNGATLGVSGWMLRGWLYVVCVWIEAIVTILVSLLGMLIAISPPYCESCRSWARKTVWKFRLASPDRDDVTLLKTDQSARALSSVRRSSAEPNTSLDVRLRTCRCARQASISADLHTRKSEGSDKDSLLLNVPIESAGLNRVFEWAERLDSSMEGRRPTLRLASMSPAEVARRAGDPEFGIAHIPRSGGVSVFALDNRFTASLREYLQFEGDVAVAEAALSAQTDVNDRALVADAISDWPSVPEWIEVWRSLQPDSANAALVHGWALVSAAWAARGGDYKPKNYALFQQHLEAADAALERAAALDPRDAVPWGVMVTVAVGRQLPPEEQARRFKEAVRRDPNFRWPYMKMISALSTKWGQSDEKALAFARQASEKAPPGSPIAALVASGHELVAETLQRTSGRRAAAEYLRSPQIRQELLRASEKAYPASGLRHGASHDAVPTTLLGVLRRAGLKQEATRVMRVLESRTAIAAAPAAAATAY